jgi:16S rRNA (adenine1518-N6/adenine1519-N6)-dimethyltransferase
MRVRKRFGQNFLTDRSTIQRIIGAINPRPGDHIIEIGPGRGALTESLVQSGCDLTTIEIDRDLAAELTVRFPGLTLVLADVLTVDFDALCAGQRLRIVGNLPYNISTPLLFKLFLHGPRIIDMYFTLQLEVVERMIAKPSNKNYGRLSIMTQYHCHPEQLFEVPSAAFTPSPKVTSAVVQLRPRPAAVPAIDLGILEKLVTGAFSQRRKTIRNALKPFLSSEELVHLALDPGLRPENLTPEDYIRCANRVAQRETGA